MKEFTTIWSTDLRMQTVVSLDTFIRQNLADNITFVQCIVTKTRKNGLDEEQAIEAIIVLRNVT